jgi:hypothetical protein
MVASEVGHDAARIERIAGLTSENQKAINPAIRNTKPKTIRHPLGTCAFFFSEIAFAAFIRVSALT